jgi:TonB family protein
MPAAVRPGDPGVEMPKVLSEVKPSYTPDAMRALLQGRTLVEAVVLPDGRVGPARLLVGFKEDFGLHEQSLLAIRQWRFKPGMRNGQPIPVTVTVELSFTLK